MNEMLRLRHAHEEASTRGHLHIHSSRARSAPVFFATNEATRASHVITAWQQQQGSDTTHKTTRQLHSAKHSTTVQTTPHLCAAEGLRECGQGLARKQRAAFEQQLLRHVGLACNKHTVSLGSTTAAAATTSSSSTIARAQRATLTAREIDQLPAVQTLQNARALA